MTVAPSLLSAIVSTAPSTPSMALPCSQVEDDHQQYSEDENGEMSSAEAMASCYCYDVGEIVTSCQSEEEVAVKLQSLSPAQKYALLTKHSTPPEGFVFPTTFAGGCNRSFRHIWLKEHQWLAYSTLLDGAFCLPYALFNDVVKNGLKGMLVTKPFKAWHKKAEKCKKHQSLRYHNVCLEMADQLKQQIERPHEALPALIDKQKAANIARNRKILKSLAQLVLFCGRQCIALRGSSENFHTTGNPGNFLALVKLLSLHDEVLRNHITSPSTHNVMYTSPRTQNELIEVIGTRIILQDLVNEIKTAKFYSILADEVTSHNVEHLAVCARFVDRNREVREEFLSFIRIQRITGKQIAETLITFLQDNNIPLADMRGQGYDGASNMSSSHSGVQARIREVAPLATYVHCGGHCLNLVIVKSCSLPDVRHVLDRLENCCRFFLNSPKRSGLLQLVTSNNVLDTQKRKPLLDLCKTRWAIRQSAYQHFYQSFPFIVDALEVIGYQHHLDKYGDLYSDWDPKSRSEAQQIVASITSFGFIVTFMTVYQYLSHLAGITVKLQKTTLDIVAAHEMVAEVAETYKEERKNVDRGFDKIFSHSILMAEKVGAEVSMPCIARRQQHRSNPQVSSPKDYYKKTVVIPFLDHVLSTLNSQFSEAAKVASSVLGVVPSVCCSRDVNLDAALQKYDQDLPSVEPFSSELRRWVRKFESIPADERPATAAQAIKVCDPDMFPNISTMLQIACTLPVTSCECERSASALRRLHNYMRATMEQQRLSSLALMHIHYDREVDLDQVVDLFSKMHPRRLELDNLL